MKKTVSFLKTIFFSIVVVTAGFFSIVIPFNVFDNLSSRAMSFIFFGEIFIYITLGFIYLAKKELSQNKKSKQFKEKEKNNSSNLRKNNDNIWLNTAA